MAAAATAVALPPAQGIVASQPDAKPDVDATVEVQDNYFDPRSVKVERGHAVKWVWRGMNRHNIRFTKVPRGVTRKNAKSRTDGTSTRTLTANGTYRYMCSLYDGMQGAITVVPASN